MKVEQKQTGRVSLNDSFRLVWMFLRYNGILTDFCVSTEETRLARAARFALTVFLVLLVCSYAVFQLIQLIVPICSGSGTSHFAYNVLGVVQATSAIIPQYHYLINGGKFQQFFKDWKEEEVRCFEYQKCTKIRRVTNRLCILFLPMLVLPLMFFYYLNVVYSDKTIFFSCFPLIRETVNIHAITWFNSMNLYYIHLYQYLGELVPTIFFYHAGCMVEDLEKRLKHTVAEMFSDHHSVRESGTWVTPESDINAPSSSGESFRLIWKRYETIFRSVDRANSLFGILVVNSQFRSFFAICLLFFIAFGTSSLPDVKTIMLSLMFIDILRTVYVNQFLSHLCLSRVRMQDTMAVSLCNNWYLMSEKDRQFLVTFQSRLYTGELAASPYELYSVNKTNLLSMLSLIVTYIIVLTQMNP